MIIFVSIIFIFLFCLILFLYLGKDLKGIRNFKYKKRSFGNRFKKPKNRNSHSSSPQTLSKNIIAEETGMMIPELIVSEPSSEELKEKVKIAVDSIFSPKKENYSEIHGIKFKLEDLDPKIKNMISSKIDHLKNFKSTYNLYSVLDNPNLNMSDLSKMITTDPLLTGRILKIANSAYFGVQHKVTSIGHALMVIGLLNIKTILYQEGLLKLLKSNSTSVIVNSLWEHLIITSICASHFQGLFKGLNRGTLFTLGLLHDIGKFVMNELPLPAKPVIPSKVSITELTISDEQLIYGITHAGIGRLLFEQWSLPEWMGKIIESHHDPSGFGLNLNRFNSEDMKYLLVLFLSNQIAKVFSSEDKTTSTLNHLAPEFHHLVQKNKVLGLALDSSLCSEIRKAKTITRMT